VNESLAQETCNADSQTIVHPDYYNWHPAAECIDIVQEFEFNIGAAIKHLWRAGRKRGNTRLWDLRKAAQYIQFEIEREEKRDNRIV